MARQPQEPYAAVGFPRAQSILEVAGLSNFRCEALPDLSIPRNVATLTFYCIDKYIPQG